MIERDHLELFQQSISGRQNLGMNIFICNLSKEIGIEVVEYRAIRIEPPC